MILFFKLSLVPVVLSLGVAHASMQKLFAVNTFDTVRGNGGLSVALKHTTGDPQVILHDVDAEEISHFTVRVDNGILWIMDDRIKTTKGIHLFTWNSQQPIKVTLYTPNPVQSLSSGRDLSLNHDSGTLNSESLSLQANRHLNVNLSPVHGLKNLFITSKRDAVVTLKGQVDTMTIETNRAGTLKGTLTHPVQNININAERDLAVTLDVPKGVKFMRLQSGRHMTSSIDGTVDTMRVHSGRGAYLSGRAKKGMGSTAISVDVKRDLTALFCGEVTLEGQVNGSGTVYTKNSVNFDKLFVKQDIVILRNSGCS